MRGRRHLRRQDRWRSRRWGAMAYGTESIPRVDRIVGPGNAYVTEAKRQVAGAVGIDGLAGPSELTNRGGPGDIDIDMAALDLIAQAEHDPEARTFFVSPGSRADRGGWASSTQRGPGERRATRESSMLPCATRRPSWCVTSIRPPTSSTTSRPNTCSVLLPDPVGCSSRVCATPAPCSWARWTAVPFGDYGVASNHVLPTAGTARFSSGLRAADYVTVSSFVLDGRRLRRPGSRPAPRPSRRPLGSGGSRSAP